MITVTVNDRLVHFFQLVLRGAAVGDLHVRGKPVSFGTGRESLPVVTRRPQDGATGVQHRRNVS